MGKALDLGQDGELNAEGGEGWGVVGGGGGW